MTPGSIGDGTAWLYVLENHVSGAIIEKRRYEITNRSG